MKITETGIKDLVVIEPMVFGDERGYFCETFKKEWFHKHISPFEFVQDNESESQIGVLRGLHFQNPPYEQSKLVRVISGEVIDVAVDLRKSSPSYGKAFSIILNDKSKKQLFVPRGFAHGFAVLSEKAIFSYKVDNNYSAESESGITWNDPDLNIDWKLSDNEIKLSAKDKTLATFKDFLSPFE